MDSVGAFLSTAGVVLKLNVSKVRRWSPSRDGSSEEFLGGLRGPAAQNFGDAARHHNFSKSISW